MLGEKQMNFDRGVEKPMPIAKVSNYMHEAACTGLQPQILEQRMRLPNGSKLAERFPQWVRPPDEHCPHE